MSTPHDDAGLQQAALGEATALTEEAVAEGGLVLVLTGAGVSAASGIPTFRGPEGYWTVGSRVYRPEELATRAMFARDPDEVWSWYLHRLGVCRAAEPNAAHHAVADLEAVLEDGFQLITQNVDGLHLRAGSSRERTFEVHGAIDRMRCAAACDTALTPVPAGVGLPASGEPLAAPSRELLRCPACGGAARPHVLWFDESYDEVLYRFHSSLEAASRASLLLTVGTSAATNLPNQVVEGAVRGGAVLIDINPQRNPFGDLAERLPRGAQVPLPAVDALPVLAERIAAAVG
jgi:NAD-dependent deacetylase